MERFALDFTRLTGEEINAVINAAHKELQTRRDFRRNELVGQVADAIIALRKEFPLACLYINASDKYDDYDALGDLDVFDYLPRDREKIMELIGE